MNRLETELRGARDRGRKLFVPYITGWFPDRPTFRALLLAAQEAGADAVEVGIPFSDPSADGPVIQRASELALGAGATAGLLLEDVAFARAAGLTVPLLLMTYYNPVLQMGAAAFARQARAAGADGVLIVDLPVDEAAECAPELRREALDTVLLVAPTTTLERMTRITSACSGFVYCVSVTGVTGGSSATPDTVAGLVARVREATDLPVLVGFGIDGPQSARSISAVSDGVVVGTALLRAVDGRTGTSAVEAALCLMKDLRSVLDGGP